MFLNSFNRNFGTENTNIILSTLSNLHILKKAELHF